MSPNERRILETYYKAVRSHLKNIKKLKEGSCLISLILHMKGNKRIEILTNSSVNIREGIDKLFSKGLLIDHNGTIIISMKGIWEIEKESISVEKLMEEYDKKYFLIDTNLGDRDKVSLFSLISLGCYSRESALVISKLREKDEKEIINMIDEVVDYLSHLNVINSSTEKILGKSSTEKKTSNLFRHALDSLGRKTKAISKAVPPQIYYVDVLDENNNVQMDKFVFLIKKIFDRFDFIKKDTMKEKVIDIYTKYSHIIEKPVNLNKIIDAINKIPEDSLV